MKKTPPLRVGTLSALPYVKIGSVKDSAIRIKKAESKWPGQLAHVRRWSKFGFCRLAGLLVDIYWPLNHNSTLSVLLVGVLLPCSITYWPFGRHPWRGWPLSSTLYGIPNTHLSEQTQRGLRSLIRLRQYGSACLLYDLPAGQFCRFGGKICISNAWSCRWNIFRDIRQVSDGRLKTILQCT